MVQSCRQALHRSIPADFTATKSSNTPLQQPSGQPSVRGPHPASLTAAGDAADHASSGLGPDDAVPLLEGGVRIVEGFAWALHAAFAALHSGLSPDERAAAALPNCTAHPIGQFISRLASRASTVELATIGMATAALCVVQGASSRGGSSVTELCEIGFVQRLLTRCMRPSSRPAWRHQHHQAASSTATTGTDARVAALLAPLSLQYRAEDLAELLEVSQEAWRLLRSDLGAEAVTALMQFQYVVVETLKGRTVRADEALPASDVWNCQWTQDEISGGLAVPGTDPAEQGSQGAGEGWSAEGRQDQQGIASSPVRLNVGTHGEQRAAEHGKAQVLAGDMTLPTEADGEDEDSDADQGAEAGHTCARRGHVDASASELAEAADDRRTVAALAGSAEGNVDHGERSWSPHECSVVATALLRLALACHIRIESRDDVDAEGLAMADEVNRTAVPVTLNASWVTAGSASRGVNGEGMYLGAFIQWTPMAQAIAALLGNLYAFRAVTLAEQTDHDNPLVHTRDRAEETETDALLSRDQALYYAVRWYNVAAEHGNAFAAHQAALCISAASASTAAGPRSPLLDSLGLTSMAARKLSLGMFHIAATASVPLAAVNYGIALLSCRRDGISTRGMTAQPYPDRTGQQPPHSADGSIQYPPPRLQGSGEDEALDWFLAGSEEGDLRGNVLAARCLQGHTQLPPAAELRRDRQVQALLRAAAIAGSTDAALELAQYLERQYLSAREEEQLLRSDCAHLRGLTGYDDNPTWRQRTHQLIVEAATWYTRCFDSAASAPLSGNSTAQLAGYRLGCIRYEGLADSSAPDTSPTPDYSGAAQAYTLAARAGNGDAANALGIMLEDRVVAATAEDIRWIGQLPPRQRAVAELIASLPVASEPSEDSEMSDVDDAPGSTDNSSKVQLGCAFALYAYSAQLGIRDGAVNAKALLQGAVRRAQAAGRKTDCASLQRGLFDIDCIVRWVAVAALCRGCSV